MIVPAMYWSATAGGMSPEKTCLKKSQPRKAIENGLTSQFTKSVTQRPFGFFRTPAMLVKSILSIIG